MKLNILDLNKLKCFQAVAEKGSLQAGARHLGLTTSAGGVTKLKNGDEHLSGARAELVALRKICPANPGGVTCMAYGSIATIKGQSFWKLSGTTGKKRDGVKTAPRHQTEIYL